MRHINILALVAGLTAFCACGPTHPPFEPCPDHGTTGTFVGESTGEPTDSGPSDTSSGGPEDSSSGEPVEGTGGWGSGSEESTGGSSGDESSSGSGGMDETGGDPECMWNPLLGCICGGGLLSVEADAFGCWCGGSGVVEVPWEFCE